MVRAMIVGFVLLFQVSASAAPSVKPVMNQLLTDLTALTPYIFQEEKFDSKQNEKLIGDILQRIQKHTSSAVHQDVFESNPFAKINLEILSEHLGRTQTVFRTNKKFARYMVQASMQMCITCHTSGFNTNSFYQPESQAMLKKIKGEFNQIEYLLTTRQFTQAESLLLKSIDGLPANKLNLFQAEDALRYLALIYAVIDQNPKKGAEVFRKYAKSKNKVTASMISGITLWAEEFQSWAQETSSGKKLSGDEAIKRAQSLIGYKESEPILNFGENNFISRLRASKILTKTLEETAKPEDQARLMYLLGLVYNSLTHQLFFDLDYAYLKKCMDIDPKSKTAQSCFRSLKEMIVLNSSGSSGIHIEPEDQHLLDQYQKKILQ